MNTKFKNPLFHINHSSKSQSNANVKIMNGSEILGSTFFQNYKTRYLSLFSYYSPKCFSFIDTSYFYVPGTTFHGSQVSPYMKITCTII